MENKKGSNIIAIIFVFILIMILGGVIAYFTVDFNKLDPTAEKTMKNLSMDYFNNYATVSSSAAAYKVTLKMLKEAKDEGAEYNLIDLNNCDEDKTYATIEVDYASGEAKDAEVTLKCSLW